MAETEAIEFFNRYTGKLEQEQVYGAAWLDWTYGNPLGKLSLELVAKRAFFSRWYGWRMDSLASREKVDKFIKEFKLKAEDFADAPDSYQTFNEFFYRKLKPSARPIEMDPDVVVFPADARHLGFQDVSQVDGVFVKGQKFDLPALLSDAALAAKYAKGTLILSRLCPVDYHRFHFTAAGVPSETKLLNGPLYSVNPIALRQKLSYLWENRRWLTVLETDNFGRVLLLEIGATNVGSAVQTYQAGKKVEKGDEKGYFKFGGSSTITIFEPGRIQLSADLVENTKQCRELYARIGDEMGAAQ
ncbi:MAG TPA: phosphatidylserine decarboxylase [Verrucomicrobiae bacterium]